MEAQCDFINARRFNWNKLKINKLSNDNLYTLCFWSKMYSILIWLSDYTILLNFLVWKGVYLLCYAIAHWLLIICTKANSWQPFFLTYASIQNLLYMFESVVDVFIIVATNWNMCVGVCDKREAQTWYWTYIILIWNAHAKTWVGSQIDHSLLPFMGKMVNVTNWILCVDSVCHLSPKCDYDVQFVGKVFHDFLDLECYESSMEDHFWLADS